MKKLAIILSASFTILSSVPTLANNIDYSKTIKLQIGNVTANVNNNDILMDTAPYIQDKTNSTMIPLRFVSTVLDIEDSDINFDKNIKSIKINDTSSIIEIEDSKNNTYTYYTNNFTTDIYSIKVLDSVTLYLDSSEIYAIDILERKYNKNFSSEIIDIDLTKNSITVFNENKIPTSIFINNDTIIFDYETLENVYLNKLTKGAKVYVVLNDNMNNVASNINIVSK